jgi:hypothetical protein
MEVDKLQEIAARDQFWASLRLLLTEIEQLASGTFGDTERERQVIQLLARIVVAELHFRAKQTEPE